MKKVLSVLLALIMVFSAVPFTGAADMLKNVKPGFLGVKVEAASTENLTFRLNDDGNSYSVSNCDMSSGSLTIPSTYNGKPVTSIGDSAFCSCESLTSITIPDSVTSIGDGAFCWCESLTSITIPDSVTSIGDCAFDDCESLTSVYITDIGAWCGISFSGTFSNPLYYAHNLYLNGEKVTDLVIPEGVTSIGDYAFCYCTSLTSITIPEQVTSIGEFAFYDCDSLISITIPDSVTGIGANAFCYTAYYNNSSNWENGVLYIGNHLIAAKYDISGAYTVKSGTKTIADTVFWWREGLTSITIPDSVTSIGYGAFYNCSSLTSISIPDSVTSIGEDAFCTCTSLTSINVSADNEYYSSVDGVFFNKDKTKLICFPAGKSGSYTIPDSVTNVCNMAFECCESLTDITVPCSVTSIGEYAFNCCTNLASIIIPDSITSIGEEAFSDTAYYNNSSNWKNGVLYIGNHLIKAKDTIRGAYTVKSGTKTIAGSAFRYCSSLTSVTIPNSVTSIGDGAFCDCESLTNITIPDSVTSIGNNAFYNCSKLTSIIIPNSVTSIGDGAFYDCESLTSVTIPDSVTSIGNNAFYNCSKLTSIIIPNSVTSIGSYAFYGCNNLTIVTKFDSFAKTYAEEHGIKLLVLCDHIRTENRVAVEPISCAEPGYTAGVYCLDCQKWLSGHEEINIGHTDADYDYICDLCKVEICDIIPEQTKKINIESGKITLLKFIPYKTEKFTFTSFSSSDTYGYLYDSDMKQLSSDDESGNDGNFKISYTLEAGKTYYFGAEFFGSSQSGSVDVLLVAYSPLTFTLNSDGNSYSVYGCDNSASGSVTIPSTYNGKPVTSIDDYAFYNCSSLTNIIIPNSVTSIGSYAFKDCDSLTSITIPDSVTCIGDYAFEYCRSLTSVTIPDSVTSIGSYAFEDCESLTSVTIPDSVTSIGSYAFEFCSKLTSITIPDSVTSIGGSAFSYTAYYNNSSNWENGVLYIGNHLIRAKDTIRGAYTVKSGTKTIADYAFQFCTNLTSITIPDSVTSIGSYAFYRCDNLTIYCFSGSYAQKYAEENDIPFAVITHTHDYTAVHTKLPTCTETGVDTYTCPCGDSYTETVKAFGHNYSTEWTVDTPATCTAAGSKSHHCTRCTEKTDVTSIPAMGHTLQLQTAEVAPTCTTSGKTAVYKCENCSYTEGGATMPVLGHNYSTEWTVDTPATCTADGSKSHHCTRCTEKTDVTSISAIGHTLQLQTAEVAPTCTTSGKTAVYKCENCSYTEGGETIPATGVHTYGDWITDKAATAKAAGSRHKQCKYCSATVTETVKRLKPSAPALSSVENISSGIKFTWKTVSGADNYVIYRKTGSGSFTKLATVKGSVTTYTDKSVKTNTKYTYTVAGSNTSGTGSYNKTGKTILFLSAPTTKVANKNGYINISWSKISGAKGYVIYKKTGSGSYKKLTTIKSGSTVSYKDKSVKSGTKYSYYVKAYNGSTYSGYKSGVTTMYLAPVKISSAASGKKGITVKWGKISASKGYTVYRKTGSGKYAKLATVKGATKVSYLDKSAKKGKTYTYYVVAYNGSYTGSYANTKACKDKY